MTESSKEDWDFYAPTLKKLKGHIALGLSFCPSVTNVMPPTLKKLKGHIALGSSVGAFAVRYKFKIGF